MDWLYGAIAGSLSTSIGMLIGAWVGYRHRNYQSPIPFIEPEDEAPEAPEVERKTPYGTL